MAFIRLAESVGENMLITNMGAMGSQSFEDLALLAQEAGAVLYLDARKAGGTNVGINSPLTNPFVDLVGDNDVTLSNVAGTSSDGYTEILLPNGKTMPFFSSDGSDTYGAIVNNGSLDFTNGDFAFAGAFIIPNSLQNGRFINKNGSAWTDTQYAVTIYSTGMRLYYNGSLYLTIAPLGTLSPDQLYTFKLIRKSGVLKAYVNDIKTYDATFSASLISKDFIRLFALSSNSSGTTHSDYFKGYTSILAAFGAMVDETKFDAWCTKAFADYK